MAYGYFIPLLSKWLYTSSKKYFRSGWDLFITGISSLKGFSLAMILPYGHEEANSF